MSPNSLEKSSEYDYVFVTHLPAFYKVNLYQELAKRLKIMVIFVSRQSTGRNSDFTPPTLPFEHYFLTENAYETRNQLITIQRLRHLLRDKKYKKICVNGWDLIEFWWIALTTPKQKMALALESTVNESRVTGFAGALKRYFLSRISQVFASSHSAVDLLQLANYRGRIFITQGVGIIHKSETKRLAVIHPYEKRFVFIGRLVTVKNLHFIISVFNTLPDHHLTIVGSGPLEKELKASAGKNVRFLDHVSNKELSQLFETNDFLILASVSETWGLVVEEALYHGIPVIVSKNCGVSELVKNGENGITFNLSHPQSFKEAILAINGELYNHMKENLLQNLIEIKDANQILAYQKANSSS